MLTMMKKFWAKFGYGENTRAVISIHMAKDGVIDVETKGDGVDLVFYSFILQEGLAKDIIKK